MSTDFYYRCETCEIENRGADNQRNPREMKALAATISKVGHTIAEAEALLKPFEFVLAHVWDLAQNSNLSFLLEHRGHKIEVFDEYGKRWGACGKPLSCGECKNRHYCVMLEGHFSQCTFHREEKT